jgi:putative ABC transport system ATP-binding protein
VTALEDVSLEIDRGEFVVVLGPSGSGKTTLLNLIGALDTPTEGRIVLQGETSQRPRGGSFSGFDVTR